MGRFTTNVFYLEPKDGPLINLPFAPPALRRRAKLPTCGTAVEHVGSAGESVYRLVLARPARHDPEGLD